MALRILVGTTTIDLAFVAHLAASAKGAIMAFDLPKPVPSSINVTLFLDLSNKFNTIT